MKWKNILKSVFPKEGETPEEFLERRGGSKNIVFPQRERGFKNRPQKVNPELEREMKFIRDLDAFKNLIQSEFAYTVSDYTKPQSLLFTEFIQILDSGPELEKFEYHKEFREIITDMEKFELLCLSVYMNNIFKMAQANNMNAIIDDRKTRKDEIKNIEKLDSIYSLYKKGYTETNVKEHLEAVINIEFVNGCRILETMFSALVPEIKLKLKMDVCLKIQRIIEKNNIELKDFLADIIQETVEEQLKRTTDIYLAHYMCEFYIPNEMPKEGNVGELYRIMFRTKEDMLGLIKSYKDLFSTVGEKIRIVKVVKNIGPKPNQLVETNYKDYASRNVAKALFKKYFETEMLDPIIDEEKKRIKGGYMTRSSIDTPEWFNEVRDILLVDSVEDFTKDLYEYLQDDLEIYDTYGDFRQYVTHSLFTSIRSRDKLKMDDDSYKTYLWNTLQEVFERVAMNYIGEHLFQTYGAEEEISEEEASAKEVLEMGVDMFIDYFFSNMNNFPAEDADIAALVSYMNRNPTGIDMLEGERKTPEIKDYKGRMRRTRRDEPTPEEGKRNIDDVLRERGRR